MLTRFTLGPFRLQFGNSYLVNAEKQKGENFMRIETSGFITALGEVKEKNGFKNCIVRIECPPVKNEFDEVVRGKEEFDCEFAVKDAGPFSHSHLSMVKESGKVQKLILQLRSFWYEEGKDKTKKLGKALVLKHYTS